MLSNRQIISCITLVNLFGLLYPFYQSCAIGTLLLQKEIYPQKSLPNLRQLVFLLTKQIVLWKMSDIEALASSESPYSCTVRVNCWVGGGYVECTGTVCSRTGGSVTCDGHTTVC